MAHTLLRRWRAAVLLPSSLLMILAISPVEAQTCGVPAGGIVNCADIAYPSGIVYAPDASDLTVNVGTPAGQAGSVTVSGVYLDGPRVAGGHLKNVLNVGPNATIIPTTYTDGIVWVSNINSSAATVDLAAQTEVNNSGSLSVAADRSSAIRAKAIATQASSGQTSSTMSADTALNNTGAVTASGRDVTGLQVWSEAAGSGIDLSRQTAIASLHNGGAVEVSGLGAVGTKLYARVVGSSDRVIAIDAVADWSNSGTITVSGDNSYGADLNLASSGFASSPVTGTVTTSLGFTNSGSITVSGIHSQGVSAEVAAVLNGPVAGVPLVTGQVTLTNSGAISVTGQRTMAVWGGAGTYGSPAVASLMPLCRDHCGGSLGTVLGRAIGIGTVDLLNSGTITATGDPAAAVALYAQQAMITNSGTITGGSGDDGVGIIAAGTTVILTNFGRIGSTNNQALNLYGDAVTVTNQTGGTITGFARLRSFATQFTNAGTWVAIGADFSTFTGGPSVLTNSGSVLVVGNQTFTGLTRFENAGLLSLSSRNATGTRPAFERLELPGNFVGNTGSLLEVGTNMTTVADVLKVNGTISGTTRIQLDPMGTPGLTAGSGILVVDASAGTTAAGAFSLVGNSSAGTLVAGGYEYALGLVPGSAGHGNWYVTSRVYPGDYQFGQIASSALAVSQTLAGSLSDLMPTEDCTAPQGEPLRVASNDTGFVPSSPATRMGAWGRFEYASLGISPSAAGDYRLNMITGHIGLDTAIRGSYGTMLFGLLFSAADGAAKSHDFASLRLATGGYNIAAYGMLLNGPWSFGLKLGGGHVKNHITDDYIDTDARLRLGSFTAQTAVSYSQGLPGDAYLKPSIELALTTVAGGSFMNGAGDRVSLGASNSLQTTLGFKIGKSFAVGGATLKPYGLLKAGYEFDGTTAVKVGTVSYRPGVTGARVEIGGGTDVDISGHLSLFAESGYVGGAKQDGWKGFVGLRYAH